MYSSRNLVEKRSMDIGCADGTCTNVGGRTPMDVRPEVVRANRRGRGQAGLCRKAVKKCGLVATKAPKGLGGDLRVLVLHVVTS